MKRIIFLIALTTSITAYGQNWGLGVRFGDLSGLTLKKYFSDNAFEISVGRTYFFYSKSTYDHYYDFWYKKHKTDYDEFTYLGYKASVPLGIQMHYIFQKSIRKVANIDISGFNGYFGLGAQLRFQNHSYSFKYKLKNDPTWYYDNDHQVSEIELGGDGVVGVEYTFENAPITLFMDFTLFMEVINEPFLFHGMGGIGLRYNF